MLLWLFVQLISKDCNLSSVVFFLPNYYFTTVPSFAVDLLSWFVCVWKLQVSITLLCTKLVKSSSPPAFMHFEIACLNFAGATMWGILLRTLFFL